MAKYRIRVDVVNEADGTVQPIIRRIVVDRIISPFPVQPDSVPHDRPGLENRSPEAELLCPFFNPVHHFIGNMVPAVIRFHPDPFDFRVAFTVCLQSCTSDSRTVHTGNYDVRDGIGQIVRHKCLPVLQPAHNPAVVLLGFYLRQT